MFDLDKYQEETRPITFKLRSGQTIETRYFENYMTEANLVEFDRKANAAQEAGTVRDVHAIYVTQLAICLAEVPAVSKGNRAPDKTKEQREKILQCLSYQDLQAMATQLSEDLARPLESEETDLSPGPQVKEKPVTEEETKTAT